MTIGKYDIEDELESWKNNYIFNLKALEYSQNTIHTYNLQINIFIEFATIHKDEFNLKNIKQMHLGAFFNFLDSESMKKSKKTLSSSTKKAYYRTLRSFFGFITNNNDELVNYDDLFKKFKIKFKISENNDFEYLNDREIDKILKYLTQKALKKQNFNNIRNKLLFKLMTKGGLRISEALSLKLNNFILNNDFYTIIFIGKGGIEQKIHIFSKIIEDELLFIKKHKEQNKFIFTTCSGKQLGRTNAYRILNNIYKKCGIRKKGCHICRHSFAMNLLDNNANISVIQKALRHKSVETTMIYANADTKMIQDALPKE